VHSTDKIISTDKNSEILNITYWHDHGGVCIIHDQLWYMCILVFVLRVSEWYLMPLSVCEICLSRTSLGPIFVFGIYRQEFSLYSLFVFPIFWLWAYMYLMKVILSIPDEGYSRNVLCTLNLISMFLYRLDILIIFLSVISQF
jgi:hypothetical protein